MVTVPGSQSVVIELDQPPGYEVTQTTGLRSNQVVSDNNLTHNKSALMENTVCICEYQNPSLQHYMKQRYIYYNYLEVEFSYTYIHCPV